jgi:hypothetical protein
MINRSSKFQAYQMTDPKTKMPSRTHNPLKKRLLTNPINPANPNSPPVIRDRRRTSAAGSMIKNRKTIT